MSTQALLACSFCARTEKQVAKLVAGPGVYICDSCVDLATKVIAEAKAQEDSAT
jgi:ATP-dependent protease Clp ATPase subunit